MAGTILAVPAIGFTAIFAVLRFPNFTVAAHATIGAFAGYVANTALGLPAWAAVVVAFLVARLVNLAGMGLAGLGGMLLGLDTSIDPLTGFRVILSVFAAAVVGGLGSIPGAVVGAVTIGVAEELSLLVLAPAYRTAIGFVAILIVLTLRPRGILGGRAY